jgi:TP901-1 family phage major tail protein
MAVSTAIMNATDVLIQFSTDNVTFDEVGRMTNASLSISMETRDTSNKDSAGFRELLSGQRSWSLAGDGLVVYSLTGADGFHDLFGYWNNRTNLYVKFGSVSGGEKNYSGRGFITSLDQEAGVEDNATFSFSFEGTGALAEGTNA